MKQGIAIILILVLVATGAFASVAWAESSVTAQIIADASDGTINGHYTAAEVRAALAFVESNPAYSMYSDIAGVLENYLASLSKPSPAKTPSPPPSTGGTPTAQGATPTTPLGGQLDYTGGQPLAVIALGGALLVCGALLRRRWA